jgi:proline iminopeptidase
MLDIHSIFTCTYILAMLNETNTSLYPATEPFHQGRLPEEDGHSVYFEECGNPSGIPVIFLHGGPGSGCTPRHRQFFDPLRCRVVLFDQRGCGRSFAKNLLFQNDTHHLIHDMERLRKHLHIDKWLVVGGSWGGGLALAYALEHPEVFTGAILRNTFLCRQSDLEWFFQDARQLMPDAWEDLVKHVPVNSQHHICEYLCEHILTTDKQAALNLALSWNGWENALMLRTHAPSPVTSVKLPDSDSLISKYLVQSHYLRNLCFFPTEGLLSHLDTSLNFNIDLLQGRLDWVCRPESSWHIHQRLPHSQLHWVDHAGHGLFEPPMISAFINAINLRITSISQANAHA